MQRSLESDLWDAWNLSSKLDPAVLSQSSNLRAAIHFERLEYKVDRKERLVEKVGLRNNSNYWDLYMLMLVGYVLLRPKDEDFGGEIKRVEIDVVFEIFGEENDPVVKLLRIHRRPIYGPILSDQNIAKMLGWIGDCDENHETCWADLKYLDHEAPTQAIPFFPARMIDVGDALKDEHPRLIITSEMQPRASKEKAIKYVALSYCWGLVDETTKLLKTTHKTIRSRTEKIELSIMPQVFQDAVVITRALGIQYLWIDSLCIIQDDARDWQIESSKMAEIFSKAYLTIIAAVGSGCNDSFLSQRVPGPSCTVPVKSNLSLATPGQFSLRFRRHRGPSDKMTEIRRSRWITRGWTFQEERLARRVLIFGESKFFFDCRTLERSQDTDRLKLRPDWVTSVTEGLGGDQKTNADSAELNKHWDHWQTLCTHYSYRELTYPEDKLPAISGMAHKMAKKVQCDYLAGLWRSNLTHDLFWETAAVATKPKNYRAPSWSWACVDGRVVWPFRCGFPSHRECRMYCTVLDVQTTPVGLDPYGGIKDGFLKVRGVLEEMKVVWVAGDRSRHPWRLCHQGEEIGKAILDMADTSIQVRGQKKVYQALLWAECKSREDNKTSIRGLLLEKNGRKRENHEEFERVGIFTLFWGVVPGQDGSHGIWDNNAERDIMII